MRFLWLNRLSERTKRIYIWCKYYNNLLIYNTKKSIDFYWYGKRRHTASIPFMITAKMKKSLQRLGYQENDINSMTPLEANNLIKCGKKKSLKEKLNMSTSEADTRMDQSQPKS
ncbi:hypothetical protein AC249_AIPGENE23897 [Exaiptasia diaphana]|nr:hypothetical protein AC249_AIPGENE23897 [Exaiptasia diaphana]